MNDEGASRLNSTMGQFLQWPGSKRRLLKPLMGSMPERFSSYAEPFLGSAAVYLALYARGVRVPCRLSDQNPWLIATYEAVREDPDRVHAGLAVHAKAHDGAYFRGVRDTLNAGKLEGADLASAFVYLNKAAWGGLMALGPDGRIKVNPNLTGLPMLPDVATLRIAAQALSHATLLCEDFATCPVVPGQLVYLDPPYEGPGNAGMYGRVSDSLLEDLGDLCRKIDEGGGYFLLSHMNTPTIQADFGHWNLRTLSLRYMLGPGAERRPLVSELLVSNYPFPAWRYISPNAHHLEFNRGQWSEQVIEATLGLS